MTAILEDIVSEGGRLLELAARDGVDVRLLGGVAIRLRAPGDYPATFDRAYKDLDFAVPPKTSAAADRFFRTAGYEPHVAFNALNSRERMLFLDNEHGRQVDVFVGEFRMCHAIPLADRMRVDDGTLPLAELLLTKCQVIELNEKDVRDALALLHGHDVSDHDGDDVNGARIAELCAADWGLWRTFTANLRVCAEHLGEYDLSPEDRERIRARIDELQRRIEDEPKSRGWRMRARIGDRKRWYDLPEEVA